MRRENEADTKRDDGGQFDNINSKKIDKIFDYSRYFVETGSRPQNFLKENEPHERFRDHPKTQELLKLKDALIQKRNHPPVYISADIS